MNLAEQRQALVGDLRLIEDPHERLTAVVERGRRLPGLSALEKVAGNRVPGCVSAVYLVSRNDDGRCRFQLDSESALIKGLAGIYCELYNGRTPAEITADPDGLVEELGLGRMVTPNRLTGIDRVRTVMHRFARSIEARADEGRVTS